MASAPDRSTSRLGATLREGAQVRPLELFFDLVFVLGITQCTALMAHNESWGGLAQGLLVLGMLWWAWVGYSWLTSVVDPEEGAVRLVMFGAMAAMLVAALCVSEAFDDLALTFALAYAAFRVAHIFLFILASPDDDALRHSVLGLAGSMAVAVALLIVASFFDGVAQGAIWALALALDMAGPFFFGAAGWKLVPHHFAERHGLVMIIAFGETLVALGIGAAGEMSFGIGAVAVLGIALVSAFWWIYFDIVALVSARRLDQTPAGRARNELARDSYSYIHLPLVAGVVLVALGMEKSIAHYDEHLHTIPAVALLGGAALYLLGLVAFRYRHIQTVNRHRLGLAIALLALIPVVGTTLPALATLALVVVALWAMIAYETRGYGETRATLRREEHGEAG